MAPSAVPAVDENRGSPEHAMAGTADQDGQPAEIGTPSTDSLTLGEQPSTTAPALDTMPSHRSASANGTTTNGTPSVAPNGVNGINGINGTNGTSINGSATNGTGTAHARVNGRAQQNGTGTDSARQPTSNLPPPTGPKFDPVAIVGMSCRLPGGVSDPEQFYQLCCLARSGWSEIPPHRFNRAGYHHPNADKLGCFNPVGGCFLSEGEDVALFDAPFFKITEREAISMDPQHRLILECTYEALENAGMPMHSLSGKDVAVYAGGSFTDYELNNLRDLDTQPMHQSTGNAPTMLANRVSYFFDFRGPSHTVETACSSSLTALHLAMEALQRRDASVAVLASSHLNLVPDHFVTMSTAGLLSGHGRSYAFDSRGSGFGRGEGAGVVILKPLADALRDNDNVRAVVVASGVNQDGRTKGITMPSGEAQLALMRKVYADAGIDPTECGYVEAHGTGTKVGDPIEMRALHDMFHEDRSPRRPLYVGSVKTNVGHLEGASGIVSMIKSAMMLERGYILPNYDFREGNKEIPFDEWGVKVPTKVLPFPRGKKYISINSFGFGGGNAHAVLAAPPRQRPVAISATNNNNNSVPGTGEGAATTTSTTTQQPTTTSQWTPAPPSNADPRRLYVVSANSKEALAAQMANITVYLEQRPVAFQSSLLSNLAYTLGQRRSFLPYKYATFASDGAALSTAFTTEVPKNPIRSAREPTVAFVFTGQGAQWHAMGRELASTYPVFLRSLERFDTHLTNCLGAPFSMLDELLGRDAKTSRLSDADLSQPGCTAVQLALVDLLRSWGVVPHAVVGHSSGEIGAAYAAGALTLEECAAAAYFRGQAVLQLKATYPGLDGGMLAVGAGAEEVWPLIKTLKADDNDGGKVTIACHNSPGSITASGDAGAVSALQALVEEKELFNRRVRVDTAYHSHHMELVADWYGQAVGPLRPSSSSSSTEEEDDDEESSGTDKKEEEKTAPVAFYSSLRGKLLDSTSELDTSYWVQNLTQPVLFSEAVTAMCRPPSEETEAAKRHHDNIDILVEIGPHSAMDGPLKQILKAITSSQKKPSYFPTLLRNKDAVSTTLSLAASLFVHGVHLDLGAINFPTPPPRPPKVLSDVPKYAWDHSTRYWWESRISRAHLFRKFPRNDVLGVLADYSNAMEPTWRNIIRLDELPWVRGHAMQGMVVYPMAGYLSMAVEAAKQKANMSSSSSSGPGKTSADNGGDAGGVQTENMEFTLRDVSISRPLVIQEGADTETNLVLRPFSDGPRESSSVWDEFRVYSWTREREWVEHCRGLVRVVTSTTSSAPSNPVHDPRPGQLADLSARKARIAACSVNPVTPEALYGELEAVSAVYSREFKSMENCFASEAGTSCVAEIVVPDTSKNMPKAHEPDVVIHPAFLDQFTHAAWVILGAGRGKLPSLFMPRFVKGLTIKTTGGGGAEKWKTIGNRMRVYGEGNADLTKPGAMKISMFATGLEGEADAVISLEELTIDPILEGAGGAGGAGHEDDKGARELCYEVRWEPLVKAKEEDADKEGMIGEAAGSDAGDSGVGIEDVPTPPSTTAADADADAEVNEDPVISEQIAIICTQSQLEQANAPGSASASLVASISAELLRRHQASGASTILLPLDNTTASHAAGKPCIVLAELDGPLLASLNTASFAHIRQLILSAKSILWVVKGAESRDPHLGMILGLARTVRSETGMRFATLDLDGNSNNHETTPVVDQQPAGSDQIAQVASLVFGKKSNPSSDEDPSDPDMEFRTLPNGVLSIPRVHASTPLNTFVKNHTSPSVPPFPQPFHQPNRPLTLTTGTKGALDTLHFTDLSLSGSSTLEPDDIQISISVTSMNFKDIMVAMGEVPSPYLGVECAGHVSALGSSVTSFKLGDRVCASTEGAYATHTKCKATSAMRVPDDMSLEQAATIPVVFATAYYALFDVARLARGESVLIHAAAGGVGQAALQLALMVGAEVYATVGSVAKKEFLVKNYGVKDEHIFYSRDASSFAGPLLRATSSRQGGGGGVDVVLNSLAGDALRQTWECLAPFGRFVEIGKRSILADSSLGMGVFERNATFASVDLTAVAKDRPAVMRRVLDDVSRLMHDYKVIRPVGPVTVFGIEEVELAFRTLQGGKTHGKILVRAGEGDVVKATYSPKIFSTLFRPDATYLVVGGTGGIGRDIVRWMVSNGARHVAILSRSDKLSPKVAELIRECREMHADAEVTLVKCDVSDSDDVTRMADEISSSDRFPPIRGLIHSAMILDDVLFEKMTFPQWRTVTLPKVLGAWNLHTALLPLPPLDFFIALSSVAGTVGNQGQAAYASANTFLDSLASYRRGALGLHCSHSLALAAVSDSGYLAEADASRRDQVFEQIGGESISSAEILALLAACISGDSSTLVDDGSGSGEGVQVVTGLNLVSHLSSGTPSSLPFWATDARFSPILTHARAMTSSSSNTSAQTQSISPGAALKRAASYADAHRIVTDALLDKAAGVLMLPREELDPTKGTVFYGLDSLVSIEIRNWITREFGAALQILDLLSSGSFASLADTVLKKTEIVKFGGSEVVAAPAAVSAVEVS